MKTQWVCIIMWLFAIAGWGQIIADSASEFSAVQGQANWYYGYYSRPFTANTFRQLETYGTDQYGWTAWRHSTNTPPWIGISATNMHPADLNYSNIQTEWAVRRWRSTHAGVITMSGTIRKLLPKTSVDDGVTAYVVVDGQTAAVLPVAAGDTNGHAFSVDATVTNGSLVDFAVSPNFNDGTDGVAFLVTISATEYRLAIAANAGEAEIRWESRTNRHYQLQRCSTLTPGAWTNLGAAAPGDGSTMLHVDAIEPGSPQKFYRLQVLP